MSSSWPFQHNMNSEKFSVNHHLNDLYNNWVVLEIRLTALFVPLSIIEAKVKQAWNFINGSFWIPRRIRLLVLTVFLGTACCAIEMKYGDRGVLAKASGNSAVIISHNQDTGKTRIKLPSGSKARRQNPCEVSYAKSFIPVQKSWDICWPSCSTRYRMLTIDFSWEVL